MPREVALADLQREVFRFLAGRGDAVVFGAQAVNAYVSEPRMTSDVDILSTKAAGLAEELRCHLGAAFRIAVRVRRIGTKGFRIYKLGRPKNKHLVDIRQVDRFPAVRRLESGITIVAPADLVAMKVIALAARAGKEKGLTDRVDLHRLLRRFPRLRADGRVGQILTSGVVQPSDINRLLATWERERMEKLGHGDGSWR